jgi:hypothetical protein
MVENEFHFPGQLMVHCFPVGGNDSAPSSALPEEAFSPSPYPAMEAYSAYFTDRFGTCFEKMT